MSIEEKMKVLRDIGYPVDEFTIAQVNRHYDRVLGMGIKHIKNVSLHPHADEFDGESVDIDLI